MTSPQQHIPAGPIDQQTDDSAADALSRLVAGNEHLITHPHLVSALYSANASPEQAQSINQFVGGLRAKARVIVAQNAGTKISLTAAEKAGLDALGVDYSKAEYTTADAVAEIKKTQPAGGTFAERLGGKGAKFEVGVGPHGDTGVAGLINTVGDATVGAVEGVGEGLTKAYNWTTSNAAEFGRDFANNVLGIASSQDAGTGPGSAAPIIAEKQTAMRDSQRRAMIASGYDPDSVFSRQAYLASGKDVTDLSDLYSQHREDPTYVDTALQYADDPEGYVKGIVGNQDLTPEQVGKALKALQSKDFADTVAKIQARRATPGNILTSFIDPVEHPDWKRYSAAGIDVAFSFAVDPTLSLLKGASAAKATVLTLDGSSAAADGLKVRAILAGETKGVYATQVRRGMESMLQSTAQIRKGLAAGDEEMTAAGYARLRSETPGLEHLADDFLGGLRPVGFQDPTVAGTALKFERAKPITTMDEAADYLSSSVGLVRLRFGRPLTESALMPGQLSAFGYKKLRGNLAAGLAARGVRRDSRLTFDLRKPEEVARILPTEGDAVDVATGKVIAAQKAFEVSESLATKFTGEARAAKSAERGALARGKQTGKWDARYPELQSTSAQSRTVAENAARQLEADRAALESAKLEEAAAKAGAERTIPAGLDQSSAVEYGDRLHDSRKGFGPEAVAARSRLMVQRYVSFLPRNTTFATADPSATLNVFRYARMYLPSGRANLLAAAYAAGDEGARKAILTGMELSTLHAAGLGKTVAGREILEHASRALNEERYASNGTLGRIVDPQTGLEREVALYDTQVNPTITLTGFSDIHRAAAKIGLWENVLGRGLNAKVTDETMRLVKAGWLTTGTNAVRNSGEDLAGAAVRGELGDVLRAKGVAINAGVLPKRTKLGQIITSPLNRVGEMYRNLKVNTADEALGLEYIARLDPETMAANADDWAMLHMGSMVDPAGIRNSDAITQAGYPARKLRMEGAGFAEAEVSENMIGSERLSDALGRVVNGNPEHARVLLAHLRDPQAAPLDTVVESLRRSPHINKMIRANTYLDDAGAYHKVVSAADREVALRQMAQLQVKDFSYLTMGRNGHLHEKLAAEIEATGKAPTAQWVMEHMTGKDRPLTVNAPQFVAVPIEQGVTGVIGTLADITGKGYKYIVENSIQRMSTQPIFLSHYGKARYELRGIEQSMIDGGLTAEVADKAATNMAMQAAFNRTVKYIDDPGLRTQMDIVGRNFFAFSRATQAFIRRWGTQLIEDPVRLRKGMLAVEGANHAGLTYTDERGDRQFIFPGSGAAVGALQDLQSLIPGVDVARVPGLTQDFTGKVMLLQPGLQNPLQMSMTPMINIPMRTIFNLFPEHATTLHEVDELLNGPQGAGKNPLGELVPTAAKKFMDGWDDDERDSMMAGSVRSAILNLAAAGKIPGPDATEDERDKFLQDLRTQTKNTLTMRAIFGFFTPAPPGQPTEATDGSQADWFYGARGIHGLSSEYKALLNDAGGDFERATAIWAELHPDKTFYTVASTKTTGGKATTIQATAASQKWMEDHLDFMHAYKSVAAYFIPAADQKGDFDLGAYNAQFEQGLRQHKDLDSFYRDVRVKGAEDLYFASVRKRDEAIAANPGQKKGITAAFSMWSKEFKSLNPLFAAKSADYSDAINTAHDQVRALRKVIAAKPAGVAGLDVVKNMVDAYDHYHAAHDQIAGSSTLAEVQRKSLTTQYGDWMKQAATEHPQFAALYQGVFRTLDSKALDQLEDVG